MKISREKAWALLNGYVKSPSLIKHSLAVEAAMRACALKYGGDIEEWGICGLLHDFDFEKFPIKERHPFEGAKILKELNYPPEIIEAIFGHASYSGVKRESLMAKCLYAVDELCGFLMALAYIRPTHFEGMSSESVKKNLKKKGFAEKISREEIEEGIFELGVDKDEHFNLLIKTLQGISKELGF